MNAILRLSSSDLGIPGAAHTLPPLFEEAARARIELMCVGAAALPISLRQQNVIPRGRFTKDIDLSFAVGGWDDYFRFVDRLLALGLFRKGQAAHRLLGPDGVMVDLIPFGGVADAASRLLWPPDNDTAMSVLGFAPVYHAAPEYLVDGRFPLRVPRPEGFLALKILAWSERGNATRKDAEDVGEILYSTCYGEELYTRYSHLIDRPDFDFAGCCAEILGIKMREETPTLAAPLAAILDKELVAEVSAFILTLANPRSYADSLRLTRALRRGLNDTLS